MKGLCLAIEEDHSSVTLCATGAQLKCKAVGGSPLQNSTVQLITRPRLEDARFWSSRSPSCWETCFSYLPLHMLESWLTSSFCLGLPAFSWCISKHMETPWLSQKANVSASRWVSSLSYLCSLSFLSPHRSLFPPTLKADTLKVFTLCFIIPQVFSLLHSLLAAGETAAQEVGGRITVKIFALRVCAMLKRDNNNKVQDKVSVKKKHKPQ